MSAAAIGETEIDDLKINFAKAENRVTGITIETQRLRLLAISHQVLNDHPEIINNSPYYDEEVMAKFANGKTRERKEVEERCELWAKRLETEQSLFIGFAGFDKNTDAFMGLIIPGHGDKPGSSELAGLLHREYWDSKFATEAAKAIAHYYLTLAKCGYKVGKHTFTEIVATVDIENPFSKKILENIGMVSDGSTSSTKHDRLKYSYCISIADLSKKYGAKVETNPAAGGSSTAQITARLKSAIQVDADTPSALGSSAASSATTADLHHSPILNPVPRKEMVVSAHPDPVEGESEGKERRQDCNQPGPSL